MHIKNVLLSKFLISIISIFIFSAKSDSVNNPCASLGNNSCHLLSYPTNCTKFYHCANNVAIEKDCAKGTMFVQSMCTCDHYDQTQCNQMTAQQSSNDVQLSSLQSSEQINSGSTNGSTNDSTNDSTNGSTNCSQSQLPCICNNSSASSCNFQCSDSCTKYVVCVHQQTVVMDCANGTMYNQSSQNCDIHYNQTLCDQSVVASNFEQVLTPEVETMTMTTTTTTMTTTATATTTTDNSTQNDPNIQVLSFGINEEEISGEVNQSNYNWETTTENEMTTSSTSLNCLANNNINKYTNRQNETKGCVMMKDKNWCQNSQTFNCWLISADGSNTTYIVPCRDSDGKQIDPNKNTTVLVLSDEYRMPGQTLLNVTCMNEMSD